MPSSHFPRFAVVSLLAIAGFGLVSGCSSADWQRVRSDLPQMQQDLGNIMDGLGEATITGGGLFRANAQLADQQGNARAAAGWSALGDAAQNSYDRQTAIQAAREGRTQINVYNQVSKNPPPPEQLVEVFMGEPNDINGDGRIDLTEIRKTDRFYAHERVAFVVVSRLPIPFTIQCKIVRDYVLLYNEPFTVDAVPEGFYRVRPLIFEVDEIAEGDYAIKGSIDGKNMKDLTFSISHSEKPNLFMNKTGF